MSNDLKECHKCKRELPKWAFARCTVKEDGLQVECRECKKEAYKRRKAERQQGAIAAEILAPKRAYKPFTSFTNEERAEGIPYIPYSTTDEAKRKREEGRARLQRRHVGK